MPDLYCSKTIVQGIIALQRMIVMYVLRVKFSENKLRMRTQFECLNSSYR